MRKYRILVRKLSDRVLLGRIILQCILGKQDVKDWIQQHNSGFANMVINSWPAE